MLEPALQVQEGADDALPQGVESVQALLRIGIQDKAVAIRVAAPGLGPGPAAHAPSQGIVFQAVDLVRLGRTQAGLETGEHILIAQAARRRFQRAGHERERRLLQQVCLFAQENRHVIARHGHFQRSSIALPIPRRDGKVAPTGAGFAHELPDAGGGMRTLLKRGGRAYQLNALPIGLHGLCRGVQPNPFQNREVMRPRRGRAEVNDLGLLAMARRHARKARDRLAPRDKDVGFAPVGGDRHGQRQLFFQKAVDHAQLLRGERGKGIDIDRRAV